MPKALFWEWTWRTVVRIFTFSLMVGVLWSAVSLPGFGVSFDPSDFRYLISFFLDVTFVYLIVYMTFTIGMTMHTWGETTLIVNRGRKHVLTGFLWSVFISLLLNLIAAQAAASAEMFPVTAGSVLVTAIVTAIIAQNTAYSVYYKYGVLDRSSRSDYEYDKSSRPRWKKVVLVIFPVPQEGKLFMGAVSGAIIVILSVWVGSMWAEAANWQAVYPVTFSLTAGIMFGGHALVIRVVDATRPGPKRESLYPYFETER